jgi:hypothetical protein
MRKTLKNGIAGNAVMLLKSLVTGLRKKLLKRRGITVSKSAEIDTQYILQVRKVSKVPDARYKTGYRELQTLSENYHVLQPNSGTGFAYSGIFKLNGVLRRLDTHGNVSLNVQEQDYLL